MNALRVVTFLRVVENDIIQDSILVNGIVHSGQKMEKMVQNIKVFFQIFIIIFLRSSQNLAHSIRKKIQNSTPPILVHFFWISTQCAVCHAHCSY